MTIFVQQTILTAAVKAQCHSLSLHSSKVVTMKMPCDSVSILGRDADTMGAITCAIAGAYYHQIPASLYEFGINKMPEDMKDIINKFDREHGGIVSYKWYKLEFPKEDLIIKARSGEIFI